MPPRSPDQTLRQLGAPRRIRVRADDRGRPIAVFRDRGQRWIDVAQIQDRWRIDDCWWQVETYGEISRMYYALELDGHQLMTVYRDLLSGYWYEQRNTESIARPQPVDILADKRESGGMTQEAIERRRQREWEERRAGRG